MPEKLWVCTSCGGFYWPQQALSKAKCPGCGGAGAVKDCERDESGALKVVE